MSAAQRDVLTVLGTDDLPVRSLAVRLDKQARTVQHTLDALYRRSLVSVNPDGTWYGTDRGRKKAVA